MTEQAWINECGVGHGGGGDRGCEGGVQDV